MTEKRINVKSKPGIKHSTSMKSKTIRLCIYPKDVQRITGKSERYGRMLLQKVRQYFQKEEHQFVSVEEFCQYTGLNTEQVRTVLVG
jgi:hypothetical protein